MRSLPQRSFTLIRERAALLLILRQVDRFGTKKVNEYHATVCYTDLEAAVQYGKTEMNPNWPLPVDAFGFSDFITNCSGMPMQGQQ
jgi:hypothetical protein